MAEQKTEQQGEKKKSLNMGLILQIVFAVVNLGVSGYGAYLVYAATLGWNPPKITEFDLQKERDEKAEVDSPDAPPLIFTMDKFTVNLSGEPRKTIRIEVNFEMLGKDGFEEIISYDNRAKARDRIVSILNRKQFAELESLQGKLHLKDQIAMELNNLLDQGVIKDVYFTEFVVQ